MVERPNTRLGSGDEHDDNDHGANDCRDACILDGLSASRCWTTRSAVGTSLGTACNEVAAFSALGQHVTREASQPCGHEPMQLSEDA